MQRSPSAFPAFQLLRNKWPLGGANVQEIYIDLLTFIWQVVCQSDASAIQQTFKAPGAADKFS